MIPSTSNLVCLICGSHEIIRLCRGSDQKFRGRGRFIYVRYRPCGLVFLHPGPPDQEMDRYYPDHVKPVRTDAGSSSLERIRRRLERMVARVLGHGGAVHVEARKVSS